MPNDTTPPVGTDALRPALEACASAIPPLLPRLSGVIKDREDDFLRLGSTVFGINSQAGAFSSAAREMASSVGGGALHAAIAELHERAGEARDVFGSGSSEEQIQGVTEVMGLIRTLNQAMEQFGPVIQTLKVLEITTRIESARLGSAGAGFTTLADDVKSLSKVIAEHATKVGEHSHLLMNQVAAVRDRGRRQLSSQERVVKEMFARLFAGIDELESMRADSAALVRDLAEGSRQVAESVGQVIESVQFHDITRQQVEHVEEILEQAVGEVARLPRESDAAGLAAWVRDVLRLQAPQLRQTEEMFRQAVEGLIGNLEDIAGNIDGLQGRITAVAYADRTGGASVLDTIRHQIALVVEAMHAVGGEVSEMSRSMADMARTIADVGTFVRGIEDIGEEIELIALNARVKAAHTGDQGRTLGVIAMEIQNLSMDARKRTGKVAEILTRISTVAARLSELARASDVAERVEDIQGRFEAVLDRLAALDSELGANIGHLSRLGQALVGQIRALTSTIRFHDEVTPQLLGLEKELTALESAFRPFDDELDAARQPEKLQAQLSRYTMDSERLVHLAVLGHQAAPSASDDVELFGDEGVELFGDDNVELFGDDNVELFDAGGNEPAGADDDLGDNVELF
jgi:methyl-accepting chemotaxis protein